MSETDGGGGPSLLVISPEASFAGVWPALAELLSLCVEVRGDLAEVTSWGQAFAVLLAVPGSEETGASGVRSLRARGAPEVVVAGALADHRLAVELIRAGASDYFVLPEDLDGMRGWLLDRSRRAAALERASSLSLERRRGYDFSNVLGRSPALRSAVELARRLSAHPRAGVLVTGESGTGKELLARGIHHHGTGAAHPFLTFHCAAVPAAECARELFGVEREPGAGNPSGRPGLLELAGEGTLVLEEVGALPLDVQWRLHRSLGERTARRVGGVLEYPIRGRVVATSTSPLDAAVAEGRFRKELYAELAVASIALPPLRERGDDVLLLARHFLRVLGEEHGRTPPRLGPEARRALLREPWPGNVRQLRTRMERAILLGGEELEQAASDAPDLGPRGPLVVPFPATMSEIERAAARKVVQWSEGNKSVAADALGISRSRLYRLIGEADGM